MGLRLLVGGVAALCVSTALPAQVNETARGLSYDAAFFSTFSPANADQIIQHIPGFVLEEGDSEVRGFRQAAGNVVINGRRPSAKAEALSTVLARIPAARVLRVELVSGDRFGSDYAGKPQVANIILSDAGGLAGTAEVTALREYTGAILPEGNVSALLRRGPSTFNVSIGIKNHETSDAGFDRLIDLATGAQEELRLKTTRFRNPNPNASLGWSLEESQHKSAHLNASLGLNYEKLSQTSLTQPREDAAYNEGLDQHYFTRTLEVGGDVTRPLWGGGIKLLGLANRRYRDLDDEASAATIAGASLGKTVQQQRDWREENLLRLSWASEDVAGWSADLGMEGVINRLNGAVDLSNISPTNMAMRVNLPLDDVTVIEHRGEAFANIGRPLNSELRLDLGLAYEGSRLTVSGDVAARRDLNFIKPKASLDWRARGWHAQLSVERTVSQLNFEDFVSAAELSTNRVNGGNAQLEPQRTWKLLLSADRTLLGDGRIKLDLVYDFIARVQDRVPTADGFDAPGNLGNGSLFSAVGNLDIPLTRAGVKGGRLTLYGSYVDTNVRDPYTLTDRHFSGYALFYYEVKFRQDLGRFAWGASLIGSTGSDSFRRTEVDFYRGLAPNVAAFIEFRPTRQWTLTLGGSNLTDGATHRERNFYEPDRTSALPYLQERRFRESHATGYLTVKHSFGER